MRRNIKRKVQFEGLEFDSAGERDRYIELKKLVRGKRILGLELQKEFLLVPKLMRKEVVQLKTKTKVVERVDEREARYTCDFFYYDMEVEAWVIEEVKSTFTKMLPDYVLRRKVMKYLIDKWNKRGNGDRYVFREVVMERVKNNGRNKKIVGIKTRRLSAR